MANTASGAEQLKAARAARGLTRAAVGELLGVTSKAVGHWERGKGLPSIPAQKLLAAGLGVPVSAWESNESAA